MNEWQKMEKVKIAENQKLAKELAEKLGGTVEKVLASYILIRLPNEMYGDTELAGRGIHIGKSDRTHFTVGCEWPVIEHHEYSPQNEWHIRVAYQRGVDGLIRDITSKIFPNYNAFFYEQLQIANAEVAARNNKRKAMEEIAAMFGDTVSDYDYRHSTLSEHRCEVHKIEFSEDGSHAGIQTYHLPLAVAKKVLALLIAEKHPIDS